MGRRNTDDGTKPDNTQIIWRVLSIQQENCYLSKNHQGLNMVDWDVSQNIKSKFE